jgi:hypothetical protein
MVARRICAGVLLGLIFASAVFAEDNPALRQKFKDWVYADFVTAPELQRKIVEKADGVIQSGDDVRLYTGGQNVNGRKSMTVFSYSGQLFIFELTPAQARWTGAVAALVRMSAFPSSDTTKRLNDPVFHISDLKIDQAGGIPGNKPITGTFKATQINQRILFRSIVVRMSRRSEKGTSREFAFLDKLPDDGVVRFKIDPINGGEEAPSFGPVPIFAELLVTNAESVGSIASETLATLVDILPDHEAYGRSAISRMNEMVAILASVKDRETANAAAKDYAAWAVRNKSLVDAMDRLGPVPPELEKALNDKYNAEAEKVATRLQTEIARLDQADYAGKTLFDEIDKAVAEATKSDQ